MRGYAVEVYQEDDGSFAAEVPELPGCVAGADNPADLFVRLEDAIQAWIESANTDGVIVPTPSREPEYSGRFVVRTPRSLHRELAWRSKAEGTSLNTWVITCLTAAISNPYPTARQPIGLRITRELELSRIGGASVELLGLVSGFGPAELDIPKMAQSVSGLSNQFEIVARQAIHSH